MSLAQEMATDFDSFARVQHERLLRFANRRLADWHDAEEVAQETLLRAYQHWDGFTSVDGAAAWCTTVAWRLVVDRLRLRPRAVVTDELPEPTQHHRDAADVVAARQDAALALDVLEHLPGRQAAVLWARHIEGLSYDSIGERMAMTEPTVRSLLHRARASLRANYVRRGGEMPVGGTVLPALWLRRLLRSCTRQPAALLAAATLAVGASLILLPSPAHGSSSLPAVVHLPARQPQATFRLDATRTRPVKTHRAVAVPGLRPTTAAPPARPVVAERLCAAGACLSHQHLSRLPGTAIVVRLPAGLRIGGNDRLAVSATVIGGCPALPANPLAACGSPSPGGGS